MQTIDKRHRLFEGTLEKYCPRCGEWWNADKTSFYSDKSSKDGLYIWCIACYLEYRRIKYPLKGWNSGGGLLTSSELRRRLRTIVDMRNSGTTFREIGLEFEISRQRAHQIYSKNLGGRLDDS